MRQSLRAGLLAALLLCVTALAALAQQGAQRTEFGRPDYAAWSELARQTESLLDSGEAPTPRLDDLRSDLADWRALFLEAQTANSARVDTVEAQLEALSGIAATSGDTEVQSGEESGEASTEPSSSALQAPVAEIVPEEPQAPTEREIEAGTGAEVAQMVTDDDRVRERLQALQERLAELRAPALLAAEAYVRANGLIAEIDALIRQRQAEEIFARGAMPFNPATWVAGLEAIYTAAERVVSETAQSVSDGRNLQVLARQGPIALVLAVIGLALLLPGDWMMQWAEDLVKTRSRRGQGVWSFCLSLARLLLSVAGLLLLARAILLTGLTDTHSTLIVGALPVAGAFVLLARWLAERLFPKGEGERGPFSFLAAGRRRGRMLTKWLGWALAARFAVEVLADIADAEGTAKVALLFPVHLLAAWTLFRFGTLLVAPQTTADTEEDEVAPDMRYRGALTRLVGQAARAIALLGPLMALAGYSSAATQLLYPAIETLAVLGIVLLLQRLVYDLYTLISASSNGDDALAPVLIAFLFLLLALPVLALVWGARVTDLTELWTRFREGFAMGETRISPVDFLTFAAVFAAGYVITRLVQGGLRSSVLPKTKLDIGGQNAIVAGLGYIGIFLAAVIAVTTVGLDLSSLAIVAGALSVGIGFGLQTIVSNFVSGIILLIERPISEGDWIQVGDQMGYVRDISVRSTRIETFDRTDVIIPNADLVSGQVTNWTRGNSVGRLIVPVRVAYGTEIDPVEQILREVAEAHPMVVLKPPPAVLFRGFGASSLDFEIRAILRDVNWVLDVHSEMNHEIARRFAKAGIEIPFAQQDIWFRNAETLHAREPEASPQAPARTSSRAHMRSEDTDGDPEGGEEP